MRFVHLSDLHLTELKERIEKQIVVTKEKSGGSKVDIVLA